MACDSHIPYTGKALGSDNSGGRKSLQRGIVTDTSLCIRHGLVQQQLVWKLVPCEKLHFCQHVTLKNMGEIIETTPHPNNCFSANKKQTLSIYNQTISPAHPSPPKNIEKDNLEDNVHFVNS